MAHDLEVDMKVLRCVRRSGLLAMVASLLLAPAALADDSAQAGLLNGAWSVWPSWSNQTTKNYKKIGVAYPNAMVQVLCWHDGGRVHDADTGQGSSRWFLIFYQNVGTPYIGFVSTLAIDPGKQPRVPRCVRRSGWPQPWGPPGTDGPPQEIILYHPGPGEPDAPTPDPAGGGDESGPSQVPAPTYPETSGGVAHTWSDPSSAGGTAGPVIGAFQTVQIACKLSGFRVADGNTWWYRVAQAPWSNGFFVSADAFYNNGSVSGSLHGTPFVDPVVKDC